MQNKLDYFHSTNHVIFKLIGDEKKILDVGCGTGRLLEELKQKKGCYVVGIEADKEKADVAKMRCDSVIIEDVEELKENIFDVKYFDVIVFEDTLEHLKNPQIVLEKFRRYLKDDGYVLISIPNIANWTIRLKLLTGKWGYKDLGILDKTHLKFFTLKTAKRMVEDSGFKIIHTSCTSGWNWIDWRMPFRNPANIWKGLLGYQFIFKAIKSK